MDNRTLYWVWLTRRRGLGPVTLRQLLEQIGDPAALWQADDGALARAGLSAALRKTLADKELAPARAVLDRCRETGVGVLTLTDPAYPPRLRLQADAPAVLYYKGVLPGEDRPVVGLVGARRADGTGLALARRLGAEIAACGGTVATGMARGVDAAGAEGALAEDGAVLGVLGCGPDLVYPREHAALFARVCVRGCLLSEYPPGMPPDARHFPVRNRLISALADAVAVVRAAEDSGSLITARWAAAQGRDVFAVPGDPDDPLSRGCNALLRDGAFAAASGWDILRRYQYRYPETVARREAGSRGQGSVVSSQWSVVSGQGSAVRGQGSVVRGQRSGVNQPRGLPADLTPEQRAIAEALSEGPLQLDALIARTGLPAARVLPQLTVLQIKKLLTQKPGKIYEWT